MYGRRRSSTRCTRRVVSDRFSSSIWNGGVTDGLSTVSSWHSTSMLAALQALVDGARRPRAHQALDLDAELVAQALGRLEHLRSIRIAHHLHVAFAIAQVDEDHAAVVAPAVHPSAQGHGLAQQGLGHKTTVGGTHLQGGHG